MTGTGDSAGSHVGEVVSLAPLGQPSYATVVSQSWSPALGDVLRLRAERHGQPSAVILLYGELLDRLFPVVDVAPAR